MYWCETKKRKVEYLFRNGFEFLECFRIVVFAFFVQNDGIRIQIKGEIFEMEHIQNP